MFDLREEAKNGLVDWYADRLSMMFSFKPADIQQGQFLLKIG
ncbi:Uncharacterised protein [Candidatus Bartonella washoeensis]|nr:Uncharacterised protein [Bartonella washoeensis]